MGGLANGRIPDTYVTPIAPDREVEKSAFEIVDKRLEIDFMSIGIW